MFVSCECYVLLSRGLYVELITCPEGSYRVLYRMTVIAKPRNGSP